MILCKVVFWLAVLSLPGVLNAAYYYYISCFRHHSLNPGMLCPGDVDVYFDRSFHILSKL